MKTKTNNLKTLAEFKDEFYGKSGTEKRDKLEKGYEQFKLGALIHEARIEKGLTQEELAVKSFKVAEQQSCKVQTFDF